MILGFMDESGSPGVAIRNNDFLAVSLVLFRDEEAAKKCSAAIDRLRARLGKTSTYEFHRSRNVNASQVGFLKLLPSLDFQFITIAIKKNHSRRHASYARLAELLIGELRGRVDEMLIKMDSNSVFCVELKKRLKTANLRNISVKEAKSHSENLIQLADYVVSLSARRVAGRQRSLERYRVIASKQLVFIEILE